MSSGSKPDFTIVTLKDNSIFVDSETGNAINYFTRKIYLPRLINSSNPNEWADIKYAEDFSKIAAQIFNAFITLTFILSLLFATSLKGMWLFIHFS